MPEDKKSTQPVAPALTPESAALISQIIEAARKPVKTEAEIAAERAKEQERADMRAIYAQKDRNKAAEQNTCQHVHGDGVGTHVVYVPDLNRLYCQNCALWIFSTPAEAAQNGSRVAPEKHPELWNRHYGRATRGGMQ
jgi:hypothetical protein